MFHPGESLITRILRYNSITSFGERLNDYETALNYFRTHFLQVHRKNNENRRVLYTHFTNVVVCDSILVISDPNEPICVFRIPKLRSVSSAMVSLSPWGGG